MKCKIRNKGEVELLDSDFISEGGEAKIFGKDNLVYKIYLSQKNMIPEGKILELGKLDKPNIVRPLDILKDKKDQNVGFTMSWIKDGVPLCKLFTNDYRNRMGVKPNNIIDLVKDIQTTVDFIHGKKCLMIDGNEMNYLVKQGTHSQSYFIDVNSYQTPSYPPTVMMVSIRDYHSNKLDELSDWFAFAIVVCQLFVGIHPYKGTYKTKMSLEERMKNNVSIFNKDVSLPKTVRDFSYIPQEYRDWFTDMFEKGMRILPPSSIGNINVQVKMHLIKSSQNCIITLLKEYQEDLLDAYQQDGHEVIRTKLKTYVDNKVEPGFNPDTKMTFLRNKLAGVSINPNNSKVIFTMNNGTINERGFSAQDIFEIDNQIFIKQNDKICHLYFCDGLSQIFLSIDKSWQCMPNATQILQGFAYQNILGKSWLMIPHLYEDKLMCYNAYIKELDGFKILEGKYSNHVCQIIGRKNNEFSKIIIKFDKKFTTYSVREIPNIDIHELNFTVLENGIVINMNKDDELEIFRNDPANNDLKVIKDKQISMDMKLCSFGITAMIFQGNKLYSITLK